MKTFLHILVTLTGFACFLFSVLSIIGLMNLYNPENGDGGAFILLFLFVIFPSAIGFYIIKYSKRFYKN